MPNLLPPGVARSGTITLGGTGQIIAIANTGRKGLTVQNTSSAVMRITEDGTVASAANGYILNPGDDGIVDTVASVSLWSATTGASFAATEF